MLELHLQTFCDRVLSVLTVVYFREVVLASPISFHLCFAALRDECWALPSGSD